MKRYKYLYCIFLLIAGFAALPAAARTTNDSLAHYLETAARNNPGVNAYFLAYKASLEKMPQAGAYPDPQLDIGLFLHPMEILGGRQVADFTLMQMFPWFGTRKAARTEAGHIAAMAFEQFRESRDNLFLQVYTRWFLLCRLQQQLHNSRENGDYLKQLETLAMRRFSASPAGERGGSPAMSDILRIQLEIAALENSIETISSQIDAETAAFNTLLNRHPGSMVHLPDTIVPLPFSLDLAQVAEEISLNNPMLAIIDREGASYRAKAETDKKTGYPMIGIGLRYSVIGKHTDTGHTNLPATGMNGKDMIMPMFSVSLPLYRGKYKAQQRESNIRWQASRQQYADTRNALLAEFHRAKHSLDDAAGKIALYEKQSQLAQTTYHLLVQEFVSGKGDLTGVIQVQRQLLDYRLKKAEAVAEYNTMVASIQKLVSFQAIALR